MAPNCVHHAFIPVSLRRCRQLFMFPCTSPGRCVPAHLGIRALSKSLEVDTGKDNDGKDRHEYEDAGSEEDDLESAVLQRAVDLVHISFSGLAMLVLATSSVVGSCEMMEICGHGYFRAARFW